MGETRVSPEAAGLPGAFTALVAEGGSGTQVVVAPWYAEADA